MHKGVVEVYRVLETTPDYALELRLLDEAAVVLVEYLEDIFDFLGCLGRQATQLEELLVAE